MKKEDEFFIYLLENYSEYKQTSTTDIINKLDKLNLTQLVYGMYERYHSEAIENAFNDIDELIIEQEEKINLEKEID